MKKNYELTGNSTFIPILKKLLIMTKLVIIMVCVAGLLTTSAKTKAQQTKISLDFENTTIREVLSYIEDNSEYSFMYNNNKVNVSRKLDIRVSGKEVEEVLNQLFADEQMVYQRLGNHIIIMPQEDTGSFSSQQQAIAGVVTDDDGNPLPGVTVLVKGTTNGTVTNNEGRYRLNNVPPDATLEFSFVGMQKLEIPVEGKSVIDARLSETSIGVDEVIVVGYTTQKKRDLTGSIASVDGEDLARTSFADVKQALQGQTAGVYVVSSSGKPGAGTSVRIRGIGGVNNSEPLYIVDGIQGVDISNINSNDIASIEVLKDASSAAIYGSRGANGVVLVTTKQGKKGTLSIEYAGSYGVQNAMNVGDVEFLSGREFAENFNAAFINDGLEPPFGGNNTAAYPREFFPDPSQITETTNWWDVATQNNAPVQEHIVSVSGGNEKQRVYTSLGYYDQDGVIKTTGFKRYNFRINSDHDVTNWLTAGNNTSLIRSEEDGAANAGSHATIWNILSENPLIPVYDENGDFAGPPHPQYGIRRPEFATMMNTDRTTTNTTIRNNFYAAVTFLKDFMLRSNLAFNHSASSFDHFSDGIYEAGVASGAHTQIWYSQTESQGYQWSNLLKYSKEVGRHNISALAGYEVSRFHSRTFDGESQYPDPTIKVVNVLLGDNANAKVTKIDGSMISYFGNVTYNFDEKYYLSGNIRRDGSSKFGADYRFGVFPSFSGAWRISGEDFFTVPFISDLKIRASYGEVGNDRMISNYGGYYAYLAPLRAVRAPMSGANGSYQVGNVYTTLANPDLKWEFSKQTNIGVDLAMFENKLSVTADYFITKVEDVLLPVSIPGTAGVSATSFTAGEYATMISNAGKLTNKGLEFDVKYSGSAGKLKYNISANLTTFDNEVTDLGDNEFLIGEVSRTYEGGSLGDFYGYVTDGIFQTQEEVDAANALDGDPDSPYQFEDTAPGDFRYKDLNDDDKITDEDRQVIGSPIPDFTYGLTFDLEYNGFTLYTLFSGVQGNDIYNGMRESLLYSGLQIRNVSKEVLQAWSGPGTSNTIPRRTAANANNIGDAQTAYLEDGSYFRLRTIQLGYNLPSAIAGKLLMKKARVYISGDNLLTFTKYKGFDPEINNSDNKNAGHDNTFYPHASAVRLGINVTF